MTDNELLLEISKMLNPMRKDIQDIKNRVKKIELTQENEILPRLNTIEACYTSTYDRYKDSVDDYEAIKQDISIIKKVVTDFAKNRAYQISLPIRYALYMIQTF